ncbi:MAG TPA: low molecular weight phosphatase family protein [Candidatus Acidoferrales bacterium]|nr:low molecular weight phosphatase family protein [Candidatus Acidoferrales bacterium]
MASAAARPPRRVLFVCVGNSCRSQFAEAAARHLAADVIAPSSAGLSPLGRIADSTRRIAAEHGWPLDGQYSKGLDDAAVGLVDLVVNLTGIPARALFPHGAPVVDWDVDDPYTEDLSVYRRVAEEIEERIRALADRIRAGLPPANGPAIPPSTERSP